MAPDDKIQEARQEVFRQKPFLGVRVAAIRLVGALELGRCTLTDSDVRSLG